MSPIIYTCPNSSFKSDVFALALSLVPGSNISTSHAKNMEPTNFCSSEKDNYLKIQKY
jgi:hypothetical protein